MIFQNNNEKRINFELKILKHSKGQREETKNT